VRQRCLMPIRTIALLLCAWSFGFFAQAAKLPPPSPIYLNMEPLEPPDIPPQIDAVIFDNRSIFVTANAAFILQNPTFFNLGFGAQLYQPQSVRFYTNSGTMLGVPGFRFETLVDVRRLSAAQRRKRGATLPKPAAAFVNNGDITVNGLLFVHSTNIMSAGRLEGDLGSRITLYATNGAADLTRGAIRIGRIQSAFAPAPGFFFNLDPELVTLYAATGTNGVYNRTNGVPLNLPTAFLFPPSVPSHQVLVNPTLSGLPVTTRITNIISFLQSCGQYSSFAEVRDFGVGARSVTLAFVETNSFIESNMTVDVRFISPFFSTNINITNLLTLNPTIAVEFRSTEFDIIEQQFQTNVITLLDSGFISPMPPPTNAFSIFPTPFNYSVIRGRVAGFDFGSPGNTNFTPSLLYDTSFATTDVTYAYSSVQYQLGPTNLSLFTPVTPVTGIPLGVLPAAADPTNFPSRVEVTSGSLNLDHTRIRAEQAIDIRTRNLISNQLATLDAPFVNLDMATTNETLVISNLMPAVVNRAHGQLAAYSATWTARVTNIITNVFFTNVVVAPVSFHVLVVGNCLQFTQPTILHRLALQATNLVIEDVVAVNNAIKLNADSITFGTNAGLQLPIRTTWAFTNFIGVSHLTNYGVLNIPGAGAFFGTAPSGYIAPPPPRRPRRRRPPVNPIEPYISFVNHGAIVAATESINSDYVENTGPYFSAAALIATNGPLFITANTVLFSNAVISAGENVEIRANDVALRNSHVSTGDTNFVGARPVVLPGALIISATNSLGDPGLTTTNQIVTTAGMRITTRPAFAGDFLGTSLLVQGGLLSDSRIVWAGDDRGPVVEGFSDNLALGRLTLEGGTNGGPIGNFFSFHGASVSNAIYVDYLELLNHATNFSFALGVSPDFTVYFADSNISPEKLDDAGEGRIRWVNQFAGPQSSTNITYPSGITYTFNAGLVRSRDRDDDGDGVVNAQDCTPISVPGFDSTLPCPGPDGAKSIALSTQNIGLSIALAPGGQAVILAWDAPAQSANAVEFTDSFSGGAWQVLTNFSNGPENARVTVRDAAAAPLRVYRVRVDAGKP
jgi:hypothetical protein